MADECGGELHEGQVMFGFAFPADPQSPKLVQPGERSFNGPTLGAQAAAPVAATRNVRTNAEPIQERPQVFRIIGFVGDQFAGASPRPAALPRTGGTSTTVGSAAFASFVLAAVSVTASGTPPASVSR